MRHCLFFFRKINQVIKREIFQSYVIHLVQGRVLLLTDNITTKLSQYAVLFKVRIYADHRVIFFIGSICKVNMSKIVEISSAAILCFAKVIDILNGGFQRMRNS